MIPAGTPVARMPRGKGPRTKAEVRRRRLRIENDRTGVRTAGRRPQPTA